MRVPSGEKAAIVELVQRLYELGVPTVPSHRAEDDAAAVGRPCGLFVLAVPVRQLPLVPAVEAHHEEVLPPVARPADAVELVEEAREPARRPPPVVLLLVCLVADAAGEGDPAGVGRPGDRLDAFLALGQPARLAAVSPQDVQLSVRLLLLA